MSDATCAIAGSLVALRAPVSAAWLAAREPLPPLAGALAVSPP